MTPVKKLNEWSPLIKCPEALNSDDGTAAASGCPSANKASLNLIITRPSYFDKLGRNLIGWLGVNCEATVTSPTVPLTTRRKSLFFSI
jgi:hypothetical protein